MKVKFPITNYYLLITFWVLIGVDQITKAIFAYRDFFFGPVKIGLVKNFGLSFGVGLNNAVSLVVVLVSLSLLSWLFVLHYFKWSSSQRLGFALIFAGGLSNVLDRLMFGFVRDVFDLGLTFTFNLADFFIVAGLILLLFRNRQPKQRVEIIND